MQNQNQQNEPKITFDLAAFDEERAQSPEGQRELWESRAEAAEAGGTDYSLGDCHRALNALDDEED